MTRHRKFFLPVALLALLGIDPISGQTSVTVPSSTQISSATPMTKDELKAQKKQQKQQEKAANANAKAAKSQAKAKKDQDKAIRQQEKTSSPQS